MNETSTSAASQCPPLADLVRRATDATYTDEYGVKLRRLFPWPGRVNTKRSVSELGLISVLIEPGKTVDSHWHDEEEAFYVIQGSAHLTIEDETTILSVGDVAYVPRLARHALTNRSSDQPCIFIDVYWDDRSLASSL